MKKFYTEVLIPKVKNWGSENRWEKLARKTLIEANMNLGASRYP
jgi:hypothetical protein